MKRTPKDKKVTWLHRTFKRKVIVFCMVINLILICIPCIFTILEMGVFFKEPTVSTEVKASKDAPVLRIVADDGFKPRSYINEAGEYVGADVETAIEAANRLGMRPEFAFSDWISARNSLNAGDADIILGLEIFSNMEGVLKTIPISSDTLNVYSKTKVTDAASLAGKKVALMAKSVIMTMFDLNCTYVEYYTNKEILQALADGEVDYAICHGSIAQNIIKENDLELEECFALMKSYPAIGVRSDQPELRESLNKVLNEMADDGTIQCLENKWVNESFNHKSLLNVIESNKMLYITYLGILLFIELIMIIFLQQSHHYNESMIYNERIKEQYNLLNSMANIYVSMHWINLKEDKASEFSTKDFLREHITENMKAGEQMRSIMTNVIVSEMQEKVLAFTDLSTLAERMGYVAVT